MNTSGRGCFCSAVQGRVFEFGCRTEVGKTCWSSGRFCQLSSLASMHEHCLSILLCFDVAGNGFFCFTFNRCYCSVCLSACLPLLAFIPLGLRLKPLFKQRRRMLCFCLVPTTKETKLMRMHSTYIIYRFATIGFQFIFTLPISHTRKIK